MESPDVKGSVSLYPKRGGRRPEPRRGSGGRRGSAGGPGRGRRAGTRLPPLRFAALTPCSPPWAPPLSPDWKVLAAEESLALISCVLPAVSRALRFLWVRVNINQFDFFTLET